LIIERRLYIMADKKGAKKFEEIRPEDK